ncbi:MAG: entericidin [Alphaproteobacteria bacterium]|nr:entericidin [Alphaproteobacteria bacterium]
MNKKLSTLFALILLAGFVSGCSNTWNGAGKDLQGFGNWLEETF